MGAPTCKLSESNQVVIEIGKLPARADTCCFARNHLCLPLPQLLSSNPIKRRQQRKLQSRRNRKYPSERFSRENLLAIHGCPP